VLTDPVAAELVRHTDLLVLVVDGTQRVVSANDAVERTLGWAPGDLQGQLVASLLSPDAAADAVDRHRWPVAPVLAGMTDTMIAAFRHRGGGSRDLHLSVTGLSDGSQVAIARDVTEEHR
jgi:PAS domain S-box-containing protein